jgi:hypothetical protein
MASVSRGRERHATLVGGASTYLKIVGFNSLVLAIVSPYFVSNDFLSKAAVALGSSFAVVATPCLILVYKDAKLRKNAHSRQGAVNDGYDFVSNAQQ